MVGRRWTAEEQRIRNQFRRGPRPRGTLYGYMQRRSPAYNRITRRNAARVLQRAFRNRYIRRNTSYRRRSYRQIGMNRYF